MNKSHQTITIEGISLRWTRNGWLLTVTLMSAISESPNAEIKNDNRTSIRYTPYTHHNVRCEYCMIWAAKLYQIPASINTPTRAINAESTSRESQEIPSNTRDVENVAITIYAAIPRDATMINRSTALCSVQSERYFLHANIWFCFCAYERHARMRKKSAQMKR